MPLENFKNLEKHRCKDGKFRYVYKTTIIKSGLFYLGKHGTKNFDDGYYGSGRLIKEHCRKFGTEGLKKEIVCFARSKEELDRLERYHVGLYYGKDPKCMNLMPGGSGGFSALNSRYTSEQKSINQKRAFENRSEEEKEKIREESRKNFRDWYDSISDKEREEVREKSREGILKWNREHPGANGGENNPMFGQTHSEDTRKRLSETHKGERNSCFGLMWITNIETNESVRIGKDETIPKGWRKGRVIGPMSQEQKDMIRDRMIGKRWITDGNENRMIEKDDPVPVGFRYGKV